MPAVTHVGSTPDEEPSSIWPGMGGWNGESGELIQDGTEQDAYNGAASQYYFWIELFPEEAEQQITNEQCS